MSGYRLSNYIGVSGVTSPEQQAELREHADIVFADLEVVLAIGVKAVHKTQWLDRPNKYGEAWYPVGEERFAGALRQDNRTDNIAQVYLEPEALSADPQYATSFIRRIKQRGQNWLHMVQFDMLPYQDAPEAFGYVIHEAKRDIDYREFYVLVQCHEAAMSEGPKTALEKLKRLSPDEIDHILFDASHGKGKEMDPDHLKRFLQAAFDDPDLAHVAFGVAGGLDATAVERQLPSILKDFPQISWDAEGKLHKTADGGLDMKAAKDYLSASAEVLKRT
jgi:hypothetical protein